MDIRSLTDIDWSIRVRQISAIPDNLHSFLTVILIKPLLSLTSKASSIIRQAVSSTQRHTLVKAYDQNSFRFHDRDIDRVWLLRDRCISQEPNWRQKGISHHLLDKLWLPPMTHIVLATSLLGHWSKSVTIDEKKSFCSRSLRIKRQNPPHWIQQQYGRRCNQHVSMLPT